MLMGIRPLSLPAVIPVAGVSFRAAAVSTVMAGQTVRIARDPGNAADPEACLVETLEGVALGFVPRSIAPRLAASLELPASAEVVEVLGGSTVGLRLRLDGGEAPSLEALGVPYEATAESDGDRVVNVLSLSGRFLGVMTARGGGAVEFSDLGGGLCTAPESLVKLEPAAVQKP